MSRYVVDTKAPQDSRGIQVAQAAQQQSAFREQLLHGGMPTEAALDGVVEAWPDFLAVDMFSDAVIDLPEWKHARITSDSGYAFDSFTLGERSATMIEDDIEDQLRHYAERTSIVSCFHTIADCSSGWGGMLSRITSSLITDEFPRRPLFVYDIGLPRTPVANISRALTWSTMLQHAATRMIPMECGVHSGAVVGDRSMYHTSAMIGYLVHQIMLEIDSSGPVAVAGLSKLPRHSIYRPVGSLGLPPTIVDPAGAVLSYPGNIDFDDVMKNAMAIPMGTIYRGIGRINVMPVGPISDTMPYERLKSAFDMFGCRVSIRRQTVMPVAFPSVFRQHIDTPSGGHEFTDVVGKRNVAPGAAGLVVDSGLSERIKPMADLLRGGVRRMSDLHGMEADTVSELGEALAASAEAYRELE